MPVADDLRAARACLQAVTRHTPPAVEVHIVPLPGAEHAHGRLGSLVEALRAPDGPTLTTAPPGDRPVLVVLQPPAIPGPGWLPSLLACLDAVPGAVQPLHTGQGRETVPWPQGFTYAGLACAVADVSPRRYPFATDDEPACIAVRRDRLPPGWELRDGVRGLRRALLEQDTSVAADDATAMLRPDRPWRERIDRGAAHALLEVRLGRRGSWEPAEPPRLACWLGIAPHHGPRGGEPTIPMRVAAKLPRPRAGRPRGRPAEPALPTYESDKDWERTSRRVHRRRRRHRGRPPSALFLLPGMGAYGGVLSVVQLVNRLLLRGVPAQIATAGPVEGAILNEPLLANPYRLASPVRLSADVPRHDLVVTTRWDTAYDGLLLADRWRAGIVSFVQDFEPDVHADDPGLRTAAEASLHLVEHKVCKSRWLEERLAAFGGSTHRIPLGLDLDVFHPGTPPRRDPPHRIVTPARPGVAHRNLEGTVAILETLTARRSDVLPTFFGKRFDVDGLHHEHVGPLHQHEVAALLCASTVVLDASRFQGFGRPGLEAMACGTPAVLTTKGGINEYAVDGVNCLQADPDDVDACVAAIERLLDDAALATSIRSAGLETARDYDAEVEADRWVSLLTSLAD